MAHSSMACSSQMREVPCCQHTVHRKVNTDLFNCELTHECTHPRTRAFNGPLSGTTQVSQCQKSKTNLYFTDARDSEWQWHQLGHIQVCTSLQTDNHASTPPLSFLQAGCPSCRPTNSVEALKAKHPVISNMKITIHTDEDNLCKFFGQRKSLESAS